MNHLNVEGFILYPLDGIRCLDFASNPMGIVFHEVLYSVVNRSSR